MTAQPRPHREKKHDRLTYHGATAEEIAVDFALAPFDRVAREMEKAWGIDRLPELVSTETAAKYGSAIAKLNAAINSTNLEETKARAEVCIRGMRAMDAEARAAGHIPTPADAWRFQVDGKPCALVRDVEDWTTLDDAAMKGVRIYTMREVALALAKYGQDVVAIKDAFPGAQVMDVRKPAPLAYDAELEDEIPW